MRRAISTIGALLCVTGCAEPSKPAARTAPEPTYTLQVTPGMAGPYPALYKGMLASWVRGTFLDPYSLRNVHVTKPVEVKASRGTFAWLVCLSANARNRYGAYTGQQAHAVLIRNSAIIDAFPKSTAPSGLGTGYDRMVDTANSMEGTLVLNLCVEAVQSGRASSEPFPELEGRAR